MACNSVAVTSTQVTSVVLDVAGLKSMVAKLLGKKEADVSTRMIGQNSIAAAAADCVREFTYEVRQTVDVKSKSVKLTLEVTRWDGNEKAAVAEQARLQPELDKLATVAQQTVILKRLAALGKLGKIEQRNGGVVAKLEITL